MRWPIQVQLLLPMMLVVLVANTMASLASGYLGSRRARSQQEDNLRRVIGTLTEANFPLTERVLRQMSGLSGAEFVLFDARGKVEAATIWTSASELEALGRVPAEEVLEELSFRPVLTVGEHRYLVGRVSLVRRPSATSGGSLAVLYREDRWREGIRQAAYPALIGGVLSGATAMGVATLLARRFVRPMRLLGDQTATIAGGRFDCVAVPRRNDEIRDLALCINRMTEKLSRYEEEIRRKERLWTLGQLGASIAHQLRNSATGARLDIELHQRECSGGCDGEPLQVALRQLRLMESYLKRFLSLGRSRPTARERVAMEALVCDALELVRPTCAHHKVELGFAWTAERLEVWGEADSLREVLVNLLLNGLEAAQRLPGVTAKVVVELKRRETGRAVVRVMDTGCGPSAQIVEQLFEPFVSEKPEGTGLGLFIARQIIEAHGGTIGWGRQNDMTCFTIELPLVSEDGGHGAPACC